MEETDKEIRKKYAQFYEERAKSRDLDTLCWKSSFHPLRSLIVNLRLNRVKECIPRSSLVLDLGCGQGHVLVKLAPMVDNIVGTEISSTRIKETDSRINNHEVKNAALALCDVLDLCFRDEVFDVIIASEIIEHVINDRRLLQECHRVLKPQGLLVVTTPNAIGLYNILRGVISLFKGKRIKLSGEYPERLLKSEHVRTFSYFTLKMKLGEARFKVLSLFGVGFMLLVPEVFLEKMIRRWRIFKTISFAFLVKMPQLLPLFSTSFLGVAKKVG